MVQCGPMLSNSRHTTTVSRVIKIQLVLGLIATIILVMHKQSLNTVLSGVVGMLLATASTIFYAKVAFAKQLGISPLLAYARHKQAMIARFTLNILFFAIVLFFYKSCDYIALFVTYFITLAGYWLSLIVRA